MGFKEPDDFARFLTIGAHAAAAITRDLEDNHEHRIIELERYARANKIWAIKVKRMRLPDLLCIRCGRRFESKGKSVLALKLSDSPKAGREWFGGGLRQDDVFGFVRVLLTDGGAETGQVVYSTRRALHEAQDALVVGHRKAVSDGSEVSVSWPSWTPSASGKVISQNDVEIVIEKSNGMKQTYRNHAKWPSRHYFLQLNAAFSAGDIVASSVALAAVDCAGETWAWFEDINSTDKDDQYAAVKAGRWLNDGRADEVLRKIAVDAEEDWRIALEAAASLSARDSSMVELIRQRATSGARDGEPMEAIFVLSELQTAEAVDALETVAATESLASELRAAAVWGIGLGAGGDVDRLLPFAADEDDFVALHAGAALPEPLTPALRDGFTSWLKSDDLRRVASAAHVLARRGEVEALVAYATQASGDSKALVLRALGDLPRASVESSLTNADETTRAALWAMWIRERDWLRGPSTDGGLDVLEKQRLVL